MKYVVILGDGMADDPVEALGGQTPLAYASTPAIDALAAKGEVGLVRTIPEGMKPGSDTANLSVLGYDPKQYYTGRSPLEALSIGVDMEEKDVALRCNLVTLTEEDVPYEQQRISTEDAKILLDAVTKEMADEMYQFYAGTSYRHCLIWKNGKVIDLTPPHDVLEQQITPYLPKDKRLLQMQERSYEILKEHPLNKERRAKGLNPANSFWFWGAGTKPALSSFEEAHGKKGAMISAVDLLKGIAVGAGMDNIVVEGANGGLDTNYEGKAQAAVKALAEDGYDFVYIHVEAPDEMGHQGSAERKVKSIEYLDQRVIRLVEEGLTQAGLDHRMLIMPDHPTPVHLRTHTDSPVPYLLYDSTAPQAGQWRYQEDEAEESKNVVSCGWDMMERLFQEK